MKFKFQIKKKIMEIECGNCGKIFILSEDEYRTKSSVTCPYCNYSVLVKNTSKKFHEIDSFDDL